MKIEIQENLVGFLTAGYNPDGNAVDDSEILRRKGILIKHFDLPELNQIALTTVNCNVDTIKKTNISNEKLVNVVMTFLVFGLLEDDDWVYDISTKCGNKSQELHNQYDEIRNSEFMKAMQAKYIEDHKLKDGLTFSQVMKEMLSLDKQEITGWDKFCHFFAQIVKLIYKMLGQGEYKSTLDEKKAHNERVEVIKAADKDGKWVKFAKDFKSEVQSSINLN